MHAYTKWCYIILELKVDTSYLFKDETIAHLMAHASYPRQLLCSNFVVVQLLHCFISEK